MASRVITLFEVGGVPADRWHATDLGDIVNREAVNRDESKSEHSNSGGRSCVDGGLPCTLCCFWEC